MRKPIIISLLIFCICNYSYAFEVPFSTYKGIMEITITGKCLSADISKPIRDFTVQISRPAKEEITVKNDVDGSYKLTCTMGTNNGKKYYRNSKVITTLGPPINKRAFIFTANGFKKKIIEIPEDKIIIGQPLVIDVVLEPNT